MRSCDEWVVAVTHASRSVGKNLPQYRPLLRWIERAVFDFCCLYWLRLCVDDCARLLASEQEASKSAVEYLSCSSTGPWCHYGTSWLSRNPSTQQTERKLIAASTTAAPAWKETIECAPTSHLRRMHKDVKTIGIHQRVRLESIDEEAAECFNTPIDTPKSRVGKEKNCIPPLSSGKRQNKHGFSSTKPNIPSDVQSSYDSRVPHAKQCSMHTCLRRWDRIVQPVSLD